MITTESVIREPNIHDANDITRVDQEGLYTGHASFREDPHDWESFSRSYLTQQAVALVATVDNNVVAWGGVNPTSSRSVYAGVGEVSIYVSTDQQGHGIGQHLLTKLVHASEKAGYWTLVAQIFPENVASLALHKALDFNTVGIRKELGKMGYGPFEGRWRDVVMLERRSSIIW